MELIDNEDAGKKIRDKAIKKFLKELETYPRVIFFMLRDKEFKMAKMIFGEAIYRTKVIQASNMQIQEHVYFWQYHLALMVIADDPYVYLKRFLETNK